MTTLPHLFPYIKYHLIVLYNSQYFQGGNGGKIIIWTLRQNYLGYTKLKHSFEFIAKFLIKNVDYIKVSLFFLVEKI